MNGKRDHGGGVDAAAARFGGARRDWLDLSTGINPVPYPVPSVPGDSWTALPDRSAMHGLIRAARSFWQVPEDLGVLAVPGASAAISHIPLLSEPGRVFIPAPTYNEHAAAFSAAGWEVLGAPAAATASVHVHPNNPDGTFYGPGDLTGQLHIVDESFCDICPGASLINAAPPERTLFLKSFGKFWGLAGLRLGFVIGPRPLLNKLAEMLGPWPVSGPALYIGTLALGDSAWATQTRARLVQDTAHMDALAVAGGAQLVGGTPLFRLYQVDDAQAWQTKLAQHQIWSRVFPYSQTWLRLGLPDATGWNRLKAALS